MFESAVDVFLLNPAQLNEVVSHVRPHTLEISILDRRHFFKDVGFGRHIRDVGDCIDLQLKEPKSDFGIVLNRALDILVLFVGSVLATDREHLEFVADVGGVDKLLMRRRPLLQNLKMDVL